jgi:hypothetical protein
MRDDTTSLCHMALTAVLRQRLAVIRVQGKACSLFFAELETHLKILDDDIRTIIEAIEDAESL